MSCTLDHLCHGPAHLRNVISGHVHKVTPTQNRVARLADKPRFGYFQVMKNCCIVDLRYIIELIYVPTKVRARGSVKLDHLEKIFQFLPMYGKSVKSADRTYERTELQHLGLNPCILHWLRN